MECKLIEAAAFEELKAIVNRIQIRTTHLATKTMPRKPGGWLTQEEVCGMLRVSKRVLQYYRRQRKIPYSMIGNKVYFRESDIQLGWHAISASICGCPSATCSVRSFRASRF